MKQSVEEFYGLKVKWVLFVIAKYDVTFGGQGHMLCHYVNMVTKKRCSLEAIVPADNHIYYTVK